MRGKFGELITLSWMLNGAAFIVLGRGDLSFKFVTVWDQGSETLGEETGLTTIVGLEAEWPLYTYWAKVLEGPGSMPRFTSIDKFEEDA